MVDSSSRPDAASPLEQSAGKGRVRLAMAFAVSAMAFSSIFISQLEQLGVPPLVIAFYRMALATLLLAPAAVILHRHQLVWTVRDNLPLLTLSGLCLAVHFGAWIWSLKYISIAASVALVNTHPVFVVIASRIFLGERLGRRALAGIGMGLGGTALICREGLLGFELELLGDALALLGALAVVGYFIIGRKMRTRLSLLAYVTPLYAICSLVLLGCVVIAGDSLYPYGKREWVLFGALAVVPTIFGHTVFNWALKHVRASAVSVSFLGEPVVAAILALVFFGQKPPSATVIGGALVLCAIYLTAPSTADVERPAESRAISSSDRPLT